MKRVREYSAKPGFFRRILRYILHPITVSLVTFFFAGLMIILAYFWIDYSDKIDALFRGEVFTPSAGIYSAPKQLRVGEKTSPEELIKYLKSAGYVEKNLQADNSRSRFNLLDNSLTIEPGSSAEIDNKQMFAPLEVKFDKKGGSVSEISDLSAKKTVKQTLLEPEVLSSITAERDGRRKAVTFKDLPPPLVKAIVVTEDRAFFEHYGVNFRGIARALWRRYEGNANSPLANQGGSSITQQLVKNLLLSSDQTLERKVKEAYMSVILETRMSKEDIFTLYANQIYLGQQAGIGIYGVGEAANAYFGKDVSALTLPEAALIAGIIRSPNRYNPYKNHDKITERRNQVLASMFEANEISQENYQEAKSAAVSLVPVKGRENLTDMPYFTQYAQEELQKIIADPADMQHLRVYTTIDPDLQRVAYNAVTTRLDKLEKRFPKKEPGNLQAALIAIRPETGEIVAMVGGRDYLKNQFNRATDAQRQPGSVFKPFVYATAINSAYEPASRVFTPATIFKDEKQVFTFGNDTYAPNNYGDTFSDKDLTLRDALVKSKNTITVGLGMELNIGKVMNLAAKAGFPKVDKAYPSMALGTAEATPLQVATAYTVFANLGEKVSPIAITRITGGDGRTVVTPEAEKSKVLQPDVAYILDDMMKDVINRGTATAAQSYGFKNVAGKVGIAGKTGTSRDGWFVGFTPHLICVVYVGFDNGDDLGMKGSDSALPVWGDFMREALNTHPEWNGDWEMPSSVQKAEIDIRDGNVIREVNASQVEPASAKEKNAGENLNSYSVKIKEQMDETGSKLPEMSVPPEFRRTEFFISGTIPVNIIPQPSVDPNTDLQPSPTETPFTTWEEAQSGQTDEKIQKSANEIPESPVVVESSIPKVVPRFTIIVCADTGKRATLYCPKKVPKTFKSGEEPKDYCPLHTKSKNNDLRNNQIN